jgi:hypothetical protein
MRKRVVNKQLDIRFIPTKYQDADGFTKQLSVWQLEGFHHNLNLDKVVIEKGCKTMWQVVVCVHVTIVLCCVVHGMVGR